MTDKEIKEYNVFEVYENHEKRIATIKATSKRNAYEKAHKLYGAPINIIEVK